MGSSVSDKSLSHLATSSYGDALTEVVEFGKQKEVWKPVVLITQKIALMPLFTRMKKQNKL
ncbi:hypothetical protein [Bacillus anthracis]|uniref:hypothetical protein n=1 Tax=Bacillus anthracis TaxID=1392 RepID=UPI00396F6F8A